MDRTKGMDESPLTVFSHLLRLQRISLKEIRPSFGRFSHDYAEAMPSEFLQNMVNDLGSAVCVGANSRTNEACLRVSAPSASEALLVDNQKEKG